MAVSVRLPQGRGPHVEHYLIEKIFKQQPVQSNQQSKSSTTSVFRLEGSEHYFSTILQLVLHYSKCQDELPVQLTLPSVLLNSNRSHLTSLALLGQEFWQSKFVSLKQLPKNSLNNETLAMINQNQQKSEESQQKQQQPTTKQYNRQQARRNNSNSSESNQSNKSSSMSMSPRPPSFDVRSRRNTSTDSASPPTTTTNNSQNIITLSTPPPLPPKNPSMICDPQNVVTAKIITENDSNHHPILSSSSPTIATTLVEVHNNQQQQISSRLPSNRLPNAFVPPPIPPRNNRNSPNGSTPPPPPQKPPLPSNGPPLSSLRSKKPHSNQQQQQQKFSTLNELLSPMSMTESEIEIAKFSLQRKIAPNILEVDEYDDDDINEKSLINRNYYNQMINQATSSPIIIEDDEIKNQKTPSPAPAHAIASFPSHHSEQLLHSLPCDVQQSVKCDVCTQTYDTNKNLQQPQQNGRITRANSSLSCFYMDPIDALVAINQQQQQPKRHSDPELASKNSQNTMDTLETNQQQQQSTFTMSHSLESLLENFRHRFATAASGSELYSIRETILNERRNQFIQQQQQQQQTNVPKHDTGFSTVDSAWQWHSVVGQNDHNGGIINRSAAAQLEHSKRSSITTNGSMKSDITTVEDLISAKAPELAVPKITHIDSINMIHKQQDQQCCNNNDRERKLTAKSIATDVCTEFSEPWNRDIVESLFISELHQGDIHQQSNHQIGKLKTKSLIFLLLLHSKLYNFKFKYSFGQM